MSNELYPKEELSFDNDNGTIVANVNRLAESVVGHRIVKAEKRPYCDPWYKGEQAFFITLDNGTEVRLVDTDDCCAFTYLESFLLHPERVDHIIMGVGTTEHYTRWHIYADFGDILELTTRWSAGNPFYYGYGFDIEVIPIKEAQR